MDMVLKTHLTLDRGDLGLATYADKAAVDIITGFQKAVSSSGILSSERASPDTETIEETEKADDSKEKSLVKVQVGDFIQWESQGALQFEKPQRVRWISDDRTHIAVDGSETGIPVQQIILKSEPEVAPAPQSPPPLDLNPSKGTQHGETSVEKPRLEGTPPPSGVSTKPIVFDIETVSGNYSYDNASDLADFISKLEKIKELLPNKG